MSTCSSESNFWAITCYFNPAGWKRRLQTYRIFRDALTIPLVTVELGFQGRFDLKSDDAEILIQIPGESVLWQKERLLNIAVEALPAECKNVAWLDCDVLFADPKWSVMATAALDTVPLVQLFRQVHYLDSGWQSDKPFTDAVIRSRQSLVSTIATDCPIDCRRTFPLSGTQGRPGLAWAAHRSLLDKHGLFDAAIIGSGDKAIICAAYGCYEHVFEKLKLNQVGKDHYLAWAEPFYADCRGQVGFVEGDIFHLWHGERANRGYSTRHHGLAQFDFDPTTDIALDQNGCWRWNSHKPELHAFIQDYFASRLEDG